MKNASIPNRSPLIILAFIIPLIYWICLFFHSSMDLKFDAVSYENLGKIIFEQGWLGYFKTGPNREPFYPLLIAFSMSLSRITSVDYQKIQTIIQIIFLFFTLFLSLKILNKLNIHSGVKALCLLYMGLSPALVNSAFSLFSEIAAYPFILYTILLCYQTITRLHRENKMTSIYWGIALGLAFLLLTSVKGIFELLSPLILGYTIVVLLLSNYPYPKKYSRIIIFTLSALLTFYIPLHYYKSLNFKYNKQYTLTDRGNWMLYGAAVKRTSEEARPKIPAEIAYSMGDNFCTRFFKQDNCTYWAFGTSDQFGMAKLSQLTAQGLTPQQVNKELLSQTKVLIKNHPLQYTLTTFIELLKFAFWESTKIGFVRYPPSLEKLFDNKIFKDGLRLGMSLLTMLGMLYTLVYLSRSKKDAADQKIMLALIVFIVVIYSGSYSLFSILTRYILPIVPLYLILIAFSFHRFSAKRK